MELSCKPLITYITVSAFLCALTVVMLPKKLYTPSQGIFVKSSQDTAIVVTPQNLERILNTHNIPYAFWWVSLSIVESGWDYESDWARNRHNIFGFHNCYFKNKMACILFLKEWINLNPPLKGEPFKNFLTRRQYNPRMDYYYNYLYNLNETRKNFKRVD